MLITIALVYVLSNGEPLEKKTFKGDVSIINSLMNKCQKFENDNAVCVMKTTRKNKDIVYTDLSTMNQRIISSK